MADTPIAELFASDPMKLSEQDLKQIVGHLQSQRARFAVGEKTAGNPTSKAKKTPADSAQLDINDILGDIL